MSTVTRSRKPVKVLRTIRVAVPASEDNPFLIVVITVGKKSDDYSVRPIPSEFGKGFEVEKIFAPDQGTYHVNLCGAYGTCECKGFVRHGHCKHVSGLKALHDAGKL